MKKMNYISGKPDKPIREVLERGKYKGYKYLILSLGTHPCAYVEIPHMHPFWNAKDYDELGIEVHGGLTFGKNHPMMDNNYCIGWDYGHFNDYNPLCPELGGKKWKTWEIRRDVFNVIRQLSKEALHEPKVICPVCHKPMSDGETHIERGYFSKSKSTMLALAAVSSYTANER